MTKWNPTEVIRGKDYKSVAFDDFPLGADGHRIRFERCSWDDRVTMSIAVTYQGGKPSPWACPSAVRRRLAKRAAVLLR